MVVSIKRMDSPTKIIHCGGGSLKYEGGWIDGHFEGYGSSYYTKSDYSETGDQSSLFEGDDVTHYRGEWVNNLYDGYGTITYPDGTEYTGNFSEGMLCGFGEFTHTTGDIHIGQFKHGLQNGEGIERRVNGTEYRGVWVDGKLNGQGTMVNTISNFTYNGEFRNGLQVGFGTYIYPTGDIYRGFTNNGIYQGTGSKKYMNGDVYTGEWSNGKQYGKGKFVWNNGDSYEGNFKVGFPHGIGTWTDNINKRIYNGRWKNGSLVQKEIYRRSISKTLGRVGPSNLPADNNDTRLDQLMLNGSKRPNFDKYHIPRESIFSGTTIHKFIHHMPSRVKEMEEGDRHNPTLYMNKPCAYFMISVYGAYKSTHNSHHKFTVPLGVRLVYFDRSLYSIDGPGIDSIISNSKFMTPSLVKRTDYTTVVPAVLFSDIRPGQQGSPTIRDTCDFLQNKVLPNQLTKNFSNWIAINAGQKDTTPRDTASCRPSIYSENMQCSNLTLIFSPLLKDAVYFKPGIYPLPNHALANYKPDNYKKMPMYTFGQEAFKGGFMPIFPRNGKSISSNPQKLWWQFGETEMLLSDLVADLPKGSTEHPCVYFISACRGVVSSSTPEFTRLIRQTSDQTQATMLTRTDSVPAK